MLQCAFSERQVIASGKVANDCIIQFQNKDVKVYCSSLKNVTIFMSLVTLKNFFPKQKFIIENERHCSYFQSAPPLLNEFPALIFLFSKVRICLIFTIPVALCSVVLFKQHCACSLFVIVDRRFSWYTLNCDSSHRGGKYGTLQA